jgi:hypothetical protein
VPRLPGVDCFLSLNVPSEPALTVGLYVFWMYLRTYLGTYGT